MFELAETLGMTVEQVGKVMSARELAEWAAYREYAGPLGSRRFDVLAARIQHTLWSIAVAKTGKPFRKKLEDFFAFCRPAKKAQSRREIVGVMGAVAAATKGGK